MRQVHTDEILSQVTESAGRSRKRNWSATQRNDWRLASNSEMVSGYPLFPLFHGFLCCRICEIHRTRMCMYVRECTVIWRSTRWTHWDEIWREGNLRPRPCLISVIYPLFMGSVSHVGFVGSAELIFTGLRPRPCLQPPLSPPSPPPPQPPTLTPRMNVLPECFNCHGC